MVNLQAVSQAQHPGPQDEAQLYAALFMLRLVARKYEFKDEEDRGPLEAVVAATFPRLVLILQVGAMPAHYFVKLPILSRNTTAHTCSQG